MWLNYVLHEFQEQFVLLFTRVILGIVMIYYGYPKIKNLSGNAKDFDGMGFKPGIFWGSLIAILEFFGGIGMILGFMTGFIAIFFGLEMIGGTIWKITKAKKPFSDYSYDIILLALCAVIIIFGAGIYSIDLTL